MSGCTLSCIATGSRDLPAGESALPAGEAGVRFRASGRFPERGGACAMAGENSRTPPPGQPRFSLDIPHFCGARPRGGAQGLVLGSCSSLLELRWRGSRMPGRAPGRPRGGLAALVGSAACRPPSPPPARDPIRDGIPGALSPRHSRPQARGSMLASLRIAPPLVLRSGSDGSPPRAEAWRRALRSASPCGRRAGRCGPSGAALFGRRLCPARIASARHPASLRRPGCSPPAHARCGFAVRSESRLRAISAPIRRPYSKIV